MDISYWFYRPGCSFYKHFSITLLNKNLLFRIWVVAGCVLVSALVADGWDFSVSVHSKFSIKSMCILARGDYEYGRVPGIRQLSPLEVGEDNSNSKPQKKWEKFKSINMVKQKVVKEVFCANSALSLVFGHFLVQRHDVFLPVFRKMTTFWVKLGSQIFQNIRPWF